MISPKQNIILIGMAGAGKSTVGVLLAKIFARPFVDTDLLIQAGEGYKLQDVLNRIGLEEFRRVEEQYVLELEAEGCVIATGGSVVYSSSAMARLKGGGVVVFLKTPLEILKKRSLHLESRGFVAAPGQSFSDVYNERLPLYQEYADICIDCGDCDHEGVIQKILAELKVLTN